MEWVAVGKISKTHGLKGEFKFHSFFDEDDFLKDLEQLKLDDSDEATQVHLQSLRGSPSNRIIKFKEVNSVDDAKALAGKTVYARQIDLKELPEGEYYWFQIKGLKVYDLSGRGYGEVVDIIKTGSNDVYVVSDGEREILLPMIDWVVKAIDLKQGTLTFDNVEGLIEDTPV